MTGQILFGILLFGCFIFLYLMSQTQVRSMSLFQYGMELDVNKGRNEPNESIFEEKCPERAVYGVMNTITSYPGSKIFTSLESYLEYYKYLGSKGLDCSFVSPARPDLPVTVEKDSQNTVDVVDEQTYALTPIKKLDDYEYSRIFEVEKDKRNQLERTTINSLTAQRQWDWSQLPFNSEFRAGQEGFMNKRRMEGFTETVTEPFYSSISGDDGAPEDTVEIDEREQAILQQYAPKKTEELMNHDKADVEVLVKKLYENDPDWEPVLEKKNGIDFEVTGLVPKRKKSDGDFEDERIPTIAEAIETGLTDRKVETTITPGFDPVQRQDPYFDKGGVIDYDGDRFFKYDNFSKWTPGLERMFAPTFDQNDWVNDT